MHKSILAITFDWSVLRTPFFRPDPKNKMVQNGKIDKNPTGSSHGEQLEPKRLTLLGNVAMQVGPSDGKH